MWTNIGKCLDDNVIIDISEKINQFINNTTDNNLLNRNWSGHLNLSAGEMSDTIINELIKNNIYKKIEDFFNIDIADKEIIVGINLNLSKSNNQHIHMDGTFADEHHILNITLVDTDTVNGAIELFPGTEVRQLNYGQFLVGGFKSNSIRVETKAGHGLLRTSRLWHRGMSNHSHVSRPMLSIVFHEKKSVDGQLISNLRSELRSGPVRISNSQWFYINKSYFRDIQHYLYVFFPLIHDLVRLLKLLIGKNSNF
jgi:hypothetical protein